LPMTPFCAKLGLKRMVIQWMSDRAAIDSALSAWRRDENSTLKS
jgi:hypothetical protein